MPPEYYNAFFFYLLLLCDTVLCTYVHLNLVSYLDNLHHIYKRKIMDALNYGLDPIQHLLCELNTFNFGE